MGLKWDNIKRHQKLPLLLHAGRQWLAPTWVLPTARLGTQRLCWVTFSALHCAHKTKRLRSEQALPFWSRSLWAQSTRPSLSLPLGKNPSSKWIELIWRSIFGRFLSIQLDPWPWNHHAASQRLRTFRPPFGVPSFFGHRHRLRTPPRRFLITCSGMMILQNNFGVVGCCCVVTFWLPYPQCSFQKRGNDSRTAGPQTATEHHQ